MRRFLALSVALLLCASAASAGEGVKKLELSLSAGSSFGVSSFSRYARNWASDFLENVSEGTNIFLSKPGAFLTEISGTYYLLPALGIQLSAAYRAARPGVASRWTADFNYEGWPVVSLQGEFVPGSARLTTVPLSLDLVGRFQLGAIKVFGQAGPALFFNSFSADASSVYGQTYFVGSYPLYGEQWTDFFRIPIRVPKTNWVAVGANFGVGAEMRIAGPVSMTVGGRYYLCPAKDLGWQWTPGTYSSFVYGYANLSNVTLTDFGTEQDLTTKLRVKPSFFALTGGIKILL